MARRYLKALDVAHWFINGVDRDSGEAITHLKLQKLLYFAQAYHLANFNRPLFAEDFEAWAHGPVVTDVWHKMKEHGWNSIPPVKDARPITDAGITSYLEAVNGKFGSFDAKHLEAITHKHLPWKEARGNLPPEASSNALIGKRTIRDFYAPRIGKTWTDRIGTGVRV
jgi:uncharacterized phage-associated protein